MTSPIWNKNDFVVICAICGQLFPTYFKPKLVFIYCRVTLKERSVANQCFSCNTGEKPSSVGHELRIYIVLFTRCVLFYKNNHKEIKERTSTCTYLVRVVTRWLDVDGHQQNSSIIIVTKILAFWQICYRSQPARTWNIKNKRSDDGQLEYSVHLLNLWSRSIITLRYLADQIYQNRNYFQEFFFRQVGFFYDSFNHCYFLSRFGGKTSWVCVKYWNRKSYLLRHSSVDYKKTM